LKGKIFYEFSKNNCCYAKRILCNELGTSFDVYISNKFLFRAESVLLGFHNILNILLGVYMAYILGSSEESIYRGVKKIKPIKARFEKFISHNGALILNNGYNSNLDSAKLIFESVGVFCRSRKIIITPGIIETENDFEYNKKFGILMARFFNEVIIVKEKNRRAIKMGLECSGFDMGKVFFADSFDEARRYIDSANKDSLVLIENDLPENFK
jgi:UDP-N-acetylmuramoyl-tripeptide--D-alanyl-D-alanine ligase